jgi:hypothetical protein
MVEDYEMGAVEERRKCTESGEEDLVGKDR